PPTLAAFPPFSRLDFAELRQRHRATHRVAEKRAGVNRLASGKRPRGIHEVCPSHARRKRKSAGQRFAKTNQIRDHAAVFAGEPFSTATETGVNLVEEQQGAMFIAKTAQHGQELLGWDVDAAADLHRFHQDGADFLPPKEAANVSLD